MKRTEQGYLCSLNNKPVNPFVWYCVGNYVECPIYVSNKEKLAEAPREAPREEPKPPPQPPEQTIIPLASAPEVKAVDVDEGVTSFIDSVLSKYEDYVRSLDAEWSKYEGDVINGRRSWEVEKVRLMEHLSLINSTIETYERRLKELDVRRMLGTIPEEKYLELREGIRAKIDKLNELSASFTSRLRLVEEGLKAHMRRVVSTSTRPDAIGVRYALERLESLVAEGRISRELYERLKAELEELVV